MIWPNTCPKCKGPVTIQLFPGGAADFYCIVCGYRVTFPRVQDRIKVA